MWDVYACMSDPHGVAEYELQYWDVSVSALAMWDGVINDKGKLNWNEQT